MSHSVCHLSLVPNPLPADTPIMHSMLVCNGQQIKKKLIETTNTTNDKYLIGYCRVSKSMRRREIRPCSFFGPDSATTTKNVYNKLHFILAFCVFFGVFCAQQFSTAILYLPTKLLLERLICQY